MAIQLTLFPQNYQGYVNTSATVNLNELAEPTLYWSLLNAVGVNDNQPHVALNTIPPVAAWNCFAKVGLTLPFAILDIFALDMFMAFPGGNGSTNQCGTYFKMSGLQIGQVYEVLVDVTNPRPYNADINQLYLGINGSQWVTTTPVCGGSGTPMTYIAGTNVAGMTTPVTFTAQNTDETLCLTYFSKGDPTYPINPLTTNEVFCIREIIVRKQSVITLLDGQKIADLYNEENIPLTLSIDNFQKAGEKQQSYSKAFKLPATKHNNEIFENLFSLDRNSWKTPSFNPYKQTRAIYKEDGHVIFQGYMRLIDVSQKDGEFSYNVNLYSESVALASLMKAEKMSAIDLNELTHSYNRQVFQNSWNGALNLQNPLPADTLAGVPGASVTNVIKYPNGNWNGQIFETANAWMIGNGATAGNPGIENLQTMFRPWIRIRYLIRKIFRRHGFTYTSNFFESAYFKRLFMDYNWGKEINWAERSQIGSVDFSTGVPAQTFAQSSYTKVICSDNNTFLTAGYDTATGTFTLPSAGILYDLTGKVKLKNPGTLGSFVTVYWKHTVNATGISSSYGADFVTIPAGEIRTLTVFSSAIAAAGVVLDIYDTLEIIVIPLLGDAALELQPTLTGISGSVTGSTVVNGTLLNTERGKLKQWDFFKGIIDMFNLVTLQDPKNPKNLIIEPYDDIFGLGNPLIQTHDWTDKVDDSEMKFTPMKLTQSTTFQYQKDKDYPFAVYEGATNGYLYGSLEWTVPDYTQVKGQTKVEAKPFAATIVKPYFASIPEWPGPCIYKGNADETAFEGIANKPRILYDVCGDTGSANNPTGGGMPLPGGLTYYIPYQNGTTGTNHPNYCLFSHVDQYPSTFADKDLNFGPCQLIGIGVPPVDNLFTTYYQNYYYELYHPDTKSVKLKVLLTAVEVSTFQFWDKVRIKNRVYRVSKINYKPQQLSDVELILVP